MPLFYTHDINGDAKLAVWHITEGEDYFLKKVAPQREVTHPHKRIQHLAGRYLLKILNPAFPVEAIELDGRRPFLPDNSWHFSISHCEDYAAAIVSRARRVGIDVELISDRMKKLEPKFLNTEEQKLVRTNEAGNLAAALTGAWSTKESLFKWYARGQVDFRQDMLIKEFKLSGEKGQIRSLFCKEVNLELVVSLRYFNRLCLSWVTG